MDLNIQLHPPDHFIPPWGTATPPLYVGGDVDPRAVLDVFEKRKISCLCRELKRGSAVVEVVA